MVRDTTVDAGCGVASYPLSPMQRGMLFHRVEDERPGVNLEQVVGELRHPVSAADFGRAWQAMVERHDCLRTCFHWPDGGEPGQQVVAAGEVALPVRVLHFATPAEAERMIEPYLAADRRAGFAALAAPLARVALFQSAARAWFVFTYHHLILDARGTLTLLGEVLDRHDALARGEEVAAEPPPPYRRYLDWLQTLDTHRAETFWREQLGGFTVPTQLPLPRPPEPPGADDDGPGELGGRIPPATVRRWRAAAARHDVTLNTLLQGAWAIVLSRYTAENDVVFGAVRACRHLPIEGAASLAGLLVNTVPLRVRLAGAATVGHWLRQLRAHWVALRDYEHTSLAEVQRWAAVPAGRPLFDTLFSLHDPSWIATLRGRGGIWAQREFDIRSQPNYPLALEIFADQSVLVRAFYDRRRYAADGVARLLHHFETAANSLADVRTDTLSRVTCLDENEHRQLIAGWNATAVDYARSVPVHQAFEARVDAAPDGIAAADAGATVTYAELNRRANRLARRLQALGIGPDVLVAVCMDRSVEMLVAWLGALKAGGAFVPLDPGYPPDRIAFQIADSAAPVLLTQPHLGGILPPLPAGVTRLELHPEGGDFGEQADDNPAATVTGRQLAYVIYTSGSTGQPKGVAIEHAALMNLVTWHQRTYGVTPADRATQIASPAFDAAVWETWPYLCAGASVHIPDADTRVSPAALWRWLAEREITLAFLPTPLAEAALAEPWPAGMALRALLTGGDALRRRAPDGFPCGLVNHYGPTESTVVATAAPVPWAGAGAPPIGRPIANTTAYVLDRESRPVPVGVPGELFLGGASLARGYWRRPELTAERFVANPFPAHAAEVPRLYRTGDLVRWRSDGQLEFLGRLDHQVKIRGCRIELGEIEGALQLHPRVREALALAAPDARGLPQLVAYVVSADASLPGGAELIGFLRGKLPGFMVPAAIVVLDAWPLTPNGKVDRRALPPPDAPDAVRSRGLASPATPEEQTIANAWAEVLARRPIGRHDNFFELGGHSLLAAQAITRLSATLGVGLSVRMLFDHPTVAEFAAALQQPGAAAGSQPPALRSKRRVAASEPELVEPR